MQVKSTRIRVWDRTVLNRLINLHLDAVGARFAAYPVASQQLTSLIGVTPHRMEPTFRNHLVTCPTGRSHFATYEQIGIRIWEHLFCPTILAPPRAQSTTRDGTQRRDVLFTNRRNGRFWTRVAERFQADFCIVDFKNYGDPVSADVIWDVSKYANSAVGKLIILVSRHGADTSVEAAQIRLHQSQATGYGLCHVDFAAVN